MPHKALKFSHLVSLPACQSQEISHCAAQHKLSAVPVLCTTEQTHTKTISFADEIPLAFQHISEFYVGFAMIEHTSCVDANMKVCNSERKVGLDKFLVSCFGFLVFVWFFVPFFSP